MYQTFVFYIPRDGHMVAETCRVHCMCKLILIGFVEKYNNNNSTNISLAPLNVSSRTAGLGFMTYAGR